MSTYSVDMAAYRPRTRKDGTVAHVVYFRIDGRQSSLVLKDARSAEVFRGVVETMGPQRALEMYQVDSGPRRSDDTGSGLTVAEWVSSYIDHLTGVDEGTIGRYRGYLHNDIEPIIGDIRLSVLSQEDMARWVQWMQESGALNRNGTRRPAKAKTIANKHGFLSAALAAAVPKHLPANPAADRRLPQGEASDADDEMVFLSTSEFATLLKSVPDYWQLLVSFLAASGCRWGEVTALRPEDVDRDQNTVRIRRAWTYSPGGYRLVKPKGKSRRTINVPAVVLGRLDYSHEWVFVNRAGGPVRIHGFWGRVWRPAVVRSGLLPQPRIHDLRHTCASWMIAAGVPLPVIQRHLGHESILTTIGVYGHLDRSSYQQASDAVESALGSDLFATGSSDE